MTTYTVYANSNDHWVRTFDADWTDARENTNSPSISGFDYTYGFAGVNYTGNYLCSQFFMSFDTSSIPSGTPTSVDLEIYLNSANSSTNIEVAETTLSGGTGDFVAGSSLGALTDFTSQSFTGGETTGVRHSMGGPADISRSSAYDLIIFGEKQRTGTAPTTSERIGFETANNTGTTEDPSLVVIIPPTLDASKGTFTLTGQAAGLARSIDMAAAATSFTLTGQAAVLDYGRAVIASAGAFTYSGVAAGLSVARTLAHAAGSFTYSGVAAALTTGRLVTMEAASYTMTGIAAGLTVARTITAAAGSFVYSGVAAVLTYARPIAADAGAFVLTGVSATLTATRKIAADAGSYTMTGVAAGFTLTRKIIAAAGSYVLTGIDAGLAWVDLPAVARRLTLSAAQLADRTITFDQAELSDRTITLE